MKYIVHIDSRDRNYTKYPNAANFRLHVPQNIGYVTSAQLLSVEIPFAFYAFSASARQNTTTTIVLNGVPGTITIPDGNYDGSSLSSAVSSALNAAFPSRAWTCSVNSTTLKFTVGTNVGTDTIGVDATAWSSRTSLAVCLGFPEGVITTGGAATGIVTGPYVVNLSPETYVMLCVEELASSASLQSALGGVRMSTKAPLGKLQIQGNPYAYSFVGTGAEDQGMATVTLDPVVAVLHHVTPSLRFHDGSLVNLGNASEYSFSMLLSTDLQIRLDESTAVPGDGSLNVVR